MLTRDEAVKYSEAGIISNRRLEDGTVIGVMKMIFTWALVYDIKIDEPYNLYKTRYCYESFPDCAKAFNEWDGEGYPPGPWIKRKGEGGDLLNPNLK